MYLEGVLQQPQSVPARARRIVPHERGTIAPPSQYMARLLLWCLYVTWTMLQK